MENLKRETAHLEEDLQAVQENVKVTPENQKELSGKSFEIQNSTRNETTERRVRAQQFGLADRARKDDGQKYGESQTREAATKDGVKKQLLCDGKLILHKIG